MVEQKEIRVLGWKKKLSEALKELGIIDEDFKGKVLIELNQGGVRSLDKTEQFE